MIDIDWYLSGTKFYGPFKIEGMDRIPSFVVFTNNIEDKSIGVRMIEITFGLYSGIGEQELECKHPNDGGYTGGDVHRKLLNKLMSDRDYDKKIIMSTFNKFSYSVYF